MGNRKQLLNKSSSQSAGENDDDDEDTIAGMLNSGSGSGKPNHNLQCNISAENMISFDASRISPSNHAINNLDTSHANMKNMVGQLGGGSLQAWANLGKQDEDGRKQNEQNRLDEDLTDPDDQLIKPQEIEKSSKTSLL